MILSASRTTVCCQNNNVITKFCISNECTYSSGMCDERQCSCNRTHRKCMGISSVQSITQNLIQRDKNMTNFDLKVIDLYDDVTKLIDINKQQFIKLSSKQQGLELRLLGDQKKLELFLKGKYQQNIKPAFIKKVVENFNSEQQIQSIQKQITNVMLNAKTQIQTILQNVRTHLNKIIYNQLQQQQILTEPNQTFFFSQDYCHNDIQVIHNRLIKKIKNPGFYRFAAIQPSINNENSPSQISILIKNFKSHVYIGAANLLSIKENHFEYPKNSQGLYLVRSNDGWTVNPDQRSQHLKSSDFSCSFGDIVKVIRQNKKTLKIINTNTKSQVFLTLSKIDQPINFCIGLNSDGDEIQIVDVGQ